MRDEPGVREGDQVPPGYPSYSSVLNDDNDQSPRAYLANATDSLKRVCSSDSGKQAVKGKHMSVTVTHSATETGSLSNGDFRYTVLYRGHGPGTVFRVGCDVRNGASPHRWLCCAMCLSSHSMQRGSAAPNTGSRGQQGLRQHGVTE